MTQARPKPLVGALLGLLLGLVTMALLTVLGILPPDRLPLFASVALAVFLTAALLTQRMSLARGRLVSVVVISALLGGFALTGIPESMRGGSTSSACIATATSSLEADPVSPSSTSAIDPFRITATDTIAWSMSTDASVTHADAQLSLMVGGFAIPLRNASFAEAPDLTQWHGETSVESQLEPIRDASGMRMTGTYHFAATADTDGGECEGNAYVRVEPTGTFDGLLLVLLWSLLAVVVVTILVLAISVRRSIRHSDAALAMIGTSAIPGATSTTPPPDLRPETKSHSNGVDRSDAHRGDNNRPEAPGREGTSRVRSERTGATADDGGRGEAPSKGRDHSTPAGAGRTVGSASGESVPPDNVDDGTLHMDEAAPTDAEPAEDGLARSPYTPEDAGVPAEERGVVDPSAPIEDHVPSDAVPREEVVPADDTVPPDNTPALEERDGGVAAGEESPEGNGSDSGAPTTSDEPEDPRST